MRFRVKDLSEFVDLRNRNVETFAQELTLRSFEATYDTKERVLNVDILPNRFPDAANVFGLTKEIARINNLVLKTSLGRLNESRKQDKAVERSLKREGVHTLVTVENKVPEACVSYIGRVVEGVQIGESPKWLKEKVEFYGFRPINAVVDSSNWVMIELGAPLHVFDLDKLNASISIPPSKKRRRLVIRYSNQGESFTTLDGKSYVLPAGVIVISDPEQPIDLLGIKGGKRPEVTEKTRTILVQAPIVDPVMIAKTTRQIGFSTEASKRFEKGVSVYRSSLAVERLCSLVQEVSGGKVLQGRIELNASVKPRLVVVSLKRARDITGVATNNTGILKLLQEIGIEQAKTKQRLQSPDTFVLAMPLDREDLSTEEDVIEEIVRWSGLNRIPSVQLSRHHAAGEEETLSFEETLRDFAVHLGFDEMINYAFCSDKEHELANAASSQKAASKGQGSSIKIYNPLSQAFTLFRTSLIPGLLRNVNVNQRHFNKFSIFEIGRTAFQLPNPTLKLQEQKRIGFLVAGKASPVVRVFHLGHQDRRATEGKSSFTRAREDTSTHDILLDLKGRVETLLKELGLGEYSFEPMPENKLFGKLGATIRIKNQEPGVIGVIGQEGQRLFGLELDVSVAELDVEALRVATLEEREYEPLPKFPAVKRDLSMLADAGVAINRIENTIYSIRPKWLEDVDLFDVYEGEGIPEGKKSLAFHLVFREQNRTLTEKEVETELGKIKLILKKKLNAKIR